LIGDCLQTGKPFRYITNIKVNSAFHPFGAGKSSTGLSVSHTANDAPVALR